MRATITTFALLAFGSVLLAACGASDAVSLGQDRDSLIVADTSEETAGPATGEPTVEPLHLGRISDFSPGVNELELPRRMFIVIGANDITGFDRKDPNNGCVLFAINETTATGGTDGDEGDDVRFFDECHGNTYDIAGRPLHCADSRAMRSIEILVEDGIAKWAGLTIDPDEPDSRSAPQCPTP